MEPKKHWEHIYEAWPTHAVSWFQPHAELSLRLIRSTGIAHDAPIIDVGGGASRLVDDLLADGFTSLTVLDISDSALDVARKRLGDAAARVTWIADDITRVALPANTYALWHDRAVFHFLTREADRAAYVAAVNQSVRPGGHVIVATFAEDGPEKCSGLPVMRYSADALHAEFGDEYTLTQHEKEAHETPFGTVQQFTYCYCRKTGPTTAP